MTVNEGFEDYNELKTLTESGKFEAALEKHLWFHEASKNISGMGGVRLSYALDLWLELAEKYSPALNALINIRNKNREMLLQGEGNFEYFHDLTAINNSLKETDDTFQVFLNLHNNFPKQAENYYHVVEELIVQNKAYEICAHYISDPIKKYFQIQKMHEMNLRVIANDPSMDTEDFNFYLKESYVNKVCQLIEILVGLEKATVATEIQKLALEHYYDYRIRDSKCS